ncbi:adenosine receptor A2a [Lingula anatina]|uniref:Adenosine receptor A2a n=1 Tax=Lingula anatina TaxID=7574 RepID=A0A1S3HRZ8_LINAN|nr:adenosine receptor A2a [Lingula anatina]XP_013387826.1 adenosine receptor A2a [Lingula anatina]XP_013387827.1 adenosine receptor A2a [Lingula anatina]XP_013387828.1 adenosine receptor A2a [Lingula anatina]XP_013387829.1 adenosine receptor A2a [Lingula anatina]XP_013387830.1 adenosine receptor A2a [Lingula anatina]|eukprot:XP_013387825.1 adenosine receptor A2a [Lingula anatina]
MAECIGDQHFASDWDFHKFSFENYSSDDFELESSEMQRAFEIYQSWNNTESDVLEEEHHMYYFIPVILCVVGVIENIISLGAIAHVRQQGDTMYHILGSLCFSDALLSSVGAAFFALHQGKGMLTLSTVCLTNVIRLVMLTSIFVGALSTVCLVIYTTLKVLRPLKNLYLLYSPRIWVLLAAIWLTSLVLGFGTYIKAAGDAKLLSYTCVCIAYGFDKKNIYIEIGITTGIIGITLVIVAVCYARVLYIAQAARRKSALLCSNEGFNSYNGTNGRHGAVVLQNSESEPPKTSLRKTTGNGAKKKKTKGPIERRLKVAVTAMLLYGVLLVFWLPYVVVNSVTSAGDLTSEDSAWYSYIVTTLFIVNAIINPLIYGLRLRRMRAGFGTMFRRIGTACGISMPTERTSLRSTQMGTQLAIAPRSSVTTYCPNSANNSPQIRRDMIK